MEVMLKNVRLRFSKSALGEAEEYKVNGVGNGKFRHSATFIYDPNSDVDKAVQAAIAKEAENTWGKKASAMLETFRGSSNKYPIQKDKRKSDGEVYEGFEGKLSLAAHRRKQDGPPTLLDNIKDPKTGGAAILTGSEGRIYEGCYVNALISIYCQEGAQGGVRASLLGIQYEGPGEGFGTTGRKANPSDFSAHHAPDVSEDSSDLA